MKEFGLKVCFFLFLAAVFSGRTNELGTLTGAIAGTVLFWPIYRRYLALPPAKPRLKVVPDEEPAQVSAE